MNETTCKAIEIVEAFIDGRDDALNIPRPAAEFIHGLVMATRAKRAIEIGTSFGYSSLWIASALQANGGALITIDHDPQKHAKASEFFERAGLTDTITIKTGTALELLDRLVGPFDFVLSDADKGNCRRYVELLIPKLSHRAVVLTDNTQTHPEELAEFLDWIRRDAPFTSCEAPIGNGMEMSVYIHPN